MPHCRAGVDPRDGVGRLALGRVRLARFCMNGYGFVVLRNVVVVFEADAIQLEVFRLDLAFVVTTAVQAQGLVHEQRAVHRGNEKLLGRGQTLVCRNPDVKGDPESKR